MANPGAAPTTPASLADVEEMWTALLDSDWNSLALVPTDHTVSAQLVIDALLSVAKRTSPPVRIIDGRGKNVADGQSLVRDVAVATSEGARVVVIVDSLMRSLSGVHLVKCVDAVILVVRVGAVDLESLSSTLAVIGTDRIRGTVTAPVAE